MNIGHLPWDEDPQSYLGEPSNVTALPIYLSLATREIRILTLIRGQYGSHIRCQMHTIDFHPWFMYGELSQSHATKALVNHKCVESRKDGNRLLEVWS